MPLSDCLERITHRQFLAYEYKMQKMWDEPSLTDHYLMQIAKWVRDAIPVKKPNRNLSSFKIKFKSRGARIQRPKDGPNQSEKSRENLTSESKADWFALTRMGRK